jgi:hypothetical protein
VDAKLEKSNAFTKIEAEYNKNRQDTEQTYKQNVEKSKTEYLNKLGMSIDTSKDIDTQIKTAEYLLNNNPDSITATTFTPNSLLEQLAKINNDTQETTTYLNNVIELRYKKLNEAFHATQQDYDHFLQQHAQKTQNAFLTSSTFIGHGEYHHPDVRSWFEFLSRNTALKYYADNDKMECTDCTLPNGLINPLLKRISLIDPATRKQLSYEIISMLAAIISEEKIADGTVTTFGNQECVKNGNRLACRKIKSELQACEEKATK